MIWLGTRGSFCVTSGIYGQSPCMIQGLMKEPQLLCREHLTQQSQHLPKILEHTCLQVWWESRNGVDKEAKTGRKHDMGGTQEGKPAPQLAEAKLRH